jgi:hypothetical protein
MKLDSPKEDKKEKPTDTNKEMQSQYQKASPVATTLNKAL